MASRERKFKKEIEGETRENLRKGREDINREGEREERERERGGRERKKERE